MIFLCFTCPFTDFSITFRISLFNTKPFNSPPHTWPKWISIEITLSVIDINSIIPDGWKRPGHMQIMNKKSFLCSVVWLIVFWPLSTATTTQSDSRLINHWHETVFCANVSDKYCYSNYWHETVIHGKMKDTTNLKFWNIRLCIAGKNFGNPGRKFPSYKIFNIARQVWIQI